MADLGPFLPTYYGPALPDVRQIVIHSVESGMTPGIGESLMTGWWRNPANKSSVHGIADPRDYCSSVPESQRAWHCGNGNGTSVGVEHAGRAAFSKDDWLTADAVRMLNNSARNTSRIAKRHGIPLRWLSVAEVRDNVKGFCTHNDMRLARGGTTHTDPGPNFPYALYMQLVQQWAGVPVGGTGTNSENTSTPAGTGGAQPADWLDMASIEDVRAVIREELAQERARVAEYTIVQAVWARNDQGGAVNIKSALNQILDEVQRGRVA